MVDQQYHIQNCIEHDLSVFKNLSLDDKESLINNLTVAVYKKGDIVLKERDNPMGLYILSEGKVKVFKEGVGGREQIVRMAKPVGFVGYRALFAEDVYNSSAVAIEDSVAVILDKVNTFKLIQSNPNLALNIIKYMAVELGFANSRTVTLTQKHIRGRLAESLLFLKDTYGYAEDKQTVKVYLSREDIANLSNMTTSNAIRTLSTFAGEKVISLEGRKIKILNLKQLEKISEMG